MTGADVPRLQDALGAEHAAVYGYGVVGAHLTGPALTVARAADALHRTRRDQLVVRLTALGARPVPAEPAYLLPFPVTDAPTALRLAAYLEDRAVAVWRAVLPDTDGELRTFALAAMVDGAVRATRWRRVAGTRPLTVALPGS